MSSNFIGPPVRDFNQLFMLAHNELRNLNRDTDMAAELVAICVFASQGNGFFCCSMEQYRNSLDALLKAKKIDIREFLKRITPTTGFRKGQVPKFEYCPIHLPKSYDNRYKGILDEIDLVMLNCNWGLAQMPGWIVVNGITPDCRMKFLRAFLGDLNMQMRQLAICYDRVLMEGKGDRYKALTVWFHVCGDRVTFHQKAARVMNLADELRTRSSLISSEYKV